MQILYVLFRLSQQPNLNTGLQHNRGRYHTLASLEHLLKQVTLSSERSPLLLASFLTGEISLFTRMHP